LIEKRAGKTISEIFAQDGENSFRELESQIVLDLAHHRGVLISTGGGLGALEENLVRLKEHALVVCLWASPDVIHRRVCHQTHRPLLQEANSREVILRLLSEREATYKKADVLVDSGMRSIREVAYQVIHQFHEARKIRSH
jgi:shikimate kinase